MYVFDLEPGEFCCVWRTVLACKATWWIESSVPHLKRASPELEEGERLRQAPAFGKGYQQCHHVAWHCPYTGAQLSVITIHGALLPTMINRKNTNGDDRLCDLQGEEVERKGFVPGTPIENAPDVSAPLFPVPSERLAPVAENEQREEAVFRDGAVIPVESTKVCMKNTGQYSENPGCNSAWDFV